MKTPRVRAKNEVTETERRRRKTILRIVSKASFVDARHSIALCVRGLNLKCTKGDASGVRQGCVLAPALFCIAIDWILSSYTGIIGTTVGSSKFTDQDYADDAVLFSDCPFKWPYILSSFDEAAHTMGLNTSWSKTKIQNLRHGVTPASVQLQGHVV